MHYFQNNCKVEFFEVMRNDKISSVGERFSTPPLPGQGSTGGLLPEGTGNIPVVGGLLPSQGSTTGLGGLLPGGTSNIPVVGGLRPFLS